MRALFSNLGEGRLRAFWRLLLTFLLSFVLFWLLSSAAVIILVVILLDRGTLSATGDVSGRYTALAGMPAVQLISLVLALLGPLCALWVAARFWDRRRFPDYGFHFSLAWRRDLFFGIFAGGVLVAAVFMLERAAGWLDPAGAQSRSSLAGLVLALLAAGFGALYQELLARGYLLRNLAEGAHGRRIGARGAVLLAWLLSSVVYAAVRSSSLGADSTYLGLSLLGVVLLGGLYGLGYVLTGELALPIGLHFGWSFFAANVFGLAAPPDRLFATTLIAVHQTGPTLWTGGAIGPEAGLAGLLAVAAGALLLVAYTRVCYGRLVICTDLARYVPAPFGNEARTGRALAPGRQVPQK
jgi:uncharacterized protein